MDAEILAWILAIGPGFPGAAEFGVPGKNAEVRRDLVGLGIVGDDLCLDVDGQGRDGARVTVPVRGGAADSGRSVRC